MFSRRTLLEWIAAITGRTIPCTPPAPPSTTAAPPVELAELPVKWCFDGPSGESWQADDIFQWLDWHMSEAVVERARHGLVEAIGPDELRRLVRRRLRQHCIEIHVPRPEWLPGAWLPHSLLAELELDARSADRPVPALVIVRHWSARPADVRPFLEARGLIRDGVVVQFENLATATVLYVPVADLQRPAGRGS